MTADASEDGLMVGIAVSLLWMGHCWKRGKGKQAQAQALSVLDFHR
jgi:hypothetical protein